MSIFYVAAAFIILGVADLFGGEKAGGILGVIMYWVGVALVIIGHILLLAPVIVWLAAQLKAAMGAGG